MAALLPLSLGQDVEAGVLVVAVAAEDLPAEDANRAVARPGRAADVGVVVDGAALAVVAALELVVVVVVAAVAAVAVAAEAFVVALALSPTGVRTVTGRNIAAVAVLLSAGSRLRLRLHPPRRCVLHKYELVWPACRAVDREMFEVVVAAALLAMEMPRRQLPHETVVHWP